MTRKPRKTIPNIESIGTILEQKAVFEPTRKRNLNRYFHYEFNGGEKNKTLSWSCP